MTVAKKSQPWVYNFSTLEGGLAGIDQTTVEFWCTVAEAYRETVEVSEVPVTVSAFANEWQRQYKKRKASTVRIYIGRVNMAIARGYDMSTFESMEHLAEVFAGKKSAPTAAPQRVTVTVKKNATVKDIDKAIKALEAKKAALLAAK